MATAAGTGAPLADAATRTVGAADGEPGFDGALRSLVDWNGVLSRGTIEAMAAE